MEGVTQACTWVCTWVCTRVCTPICTPICTRVCNDCSFGRPAPPTGLLPRGLLLHPRLVLLHLQKETKSQWRPLNKDKKNTASVQNKYDLELDSFVFCHVLICVMLVYLRTSIFFSLETSCFPSSRSSDWSPDRKRHKQKQSNKHIQNTGRLGSVFFLKNNKKRTNSGQDGPKSLKLKQH